MGEQENSKDEIKKDLDALNNYLKKDKTDDFIQFARVFADKAGINYPNYFSKLVAEESSLTKTPARVNINKGVIQVPKSMFDKNSIEYHKFKVQGNPLMIYHELLHIEGNIKHKVNVTNKRIREWFDYADGEYKDIIKSEKILIQNGHIVTKNEIKGDLVKFKMNLIKRFWWRLGWWGLKKRIFYFLVERETKKIINKK